MDIVPLSFRTLYYCGIWHEEDEVITFPKLMYQYFVTLAIFYFTFTQGAVIFEAHLDVNEFTDALFLTLTFVTLCFKIINMIYGRSEIHSFLRDFRNELCKPLTPDEAEILEVYSKKAKKIYKVMMSMAIIDTLFFVVVNIIKVLNNIMELTYRAHQFYDISNKYVFFATNFLQIGTMCYSLSINMSYDTMTAGVLMFTAGQFKLNAYRLAQLNQSNIHLLDRYIAHNRLINGTVTKIQSFFIRAVIPFFSFSLISICSTTFQVSQHSIFSFKFLGLITFAVCVLLQVFLYCWFGNEMKIKSTAIVSAAYNCDWITLDPQTRRSLYIIMLCNQNGRTVSYSGQCSLTLDTFVWIVKTSYAMLSVLQQVNS